MGRKRRSRASLPGDRTRVLMERREARTAPSSPAGWRVAGDMTGHLQRDRFRRRAAGNRESHLHLFSEGGYISPNTWSSDGEELVVFTCSWVLNKRFQGAG